jgi:hypothetical protein
MMAIQKVLFFGLILNLILTACGANTSPILGVAGTPTLVFIYTDG